MLTALHDVLTTLLVTMTVTLASHKTTFVYSQPMTSAACEAKAAKLQADKDAEDEAAALAGRGVTVAQTFYCRPIKGS